MDATATGGQNPIATDAKAEITEVVPTATGYDEQSTSGGTTIDGKTEYEVTALAVVSLAKVGKSIAARVAATLALNQGDLVAVATIEVVDQIATARMFQLRAGRLEEAMEAVLQSRCAGPDGRAIETESVISDAADAASGTISAVTGLLSHFRSETAYQGRTVDLDGRTLRKVIAGALSSAGAHVILTDALTLSDLQDPGITAFCSRLEHLAKLASRIRSIGSAPKETGQNNAVFGEGRSGDLLKAYEQFVAEFSGSSRLLTDIQAGVQLTRMIDAASRAYLLIPTVLKTGGHYRIRKSIFTALLGRDGVSFSAGASADFVVWDLRSMLVEMGDIVYHSSGNMRLPRGVYLASLANTEEKPLSKTPDEEARVPTDEERITPNVGDDEAAAAQESLTSEVPDTEPGLEAAPLVWRSAQSIATLLRQVNQMAPRRNKASDGIIGDAAHATRDSDHNPWVLDAGKGVVTAIDITNDPRNGCSAEAIAERVRASRDPRVKYIIWNRRISHYQAKDGVPPWAWKRYAGSNPHDKHVHISVRPEKALYDSTNPWSV
ncbi:hypothetical protein [Rhizobium laguerreae]|uniref:hypothetical protein n=1 Tax=Rhizobium laguerreae TaxID=1076926 RepID=UPI001C91A9E9|nr:hypothetical protein [Rhizobium laguerreae]